MPRHILVLMLVCLINFSACSEDSDQTPAQLTPAATSAYEQTFESCSLSAWEILIATKMYSMGKPVESLTNGRPASHNIQTAYRLAREEGASVPYMVGHLKLKECAGEVNERLQGATLSASETEYSRCAYDSAVRTNILVRIEKGASLEQTKSELPDAFGELVNELYEIAQDGGIVASLEFSASMLDHCIRIAKDL